MEEQSVSDIELTGLDAITARAALDPDFRRRLLCDPREAIARTFGVELPATLRVKFIEKEPGLYPAQRSLRNDSMT